MTIRQPKDHKQSSSCNFIFYHHDDIIKTIQAAKGVKHRLNGCLNHRIKRQFFENTARGQIWKKRPLNGQNTLNMAKIRGFKNT